MKMLQGIGIGLILLWWWVCEENRANPSIRYLPSARMPKRPDGQPMRGRYSPFCGIYINEEFRNDPRILNHELAHWQQHQRLGTIGFYLRYLSELWQYGYDRMALEVEARYAEGKWCAEHPGECEKSSTPYHT